MRRPYSPNGPRSCSGYKGGAAGGRCAYAPPLEEGGRLPIAIVNAEIPKRSYVVKVALRQNQKGPSPYARSETHVRSPHSHMNMRTVRPFFESSILLAS